MFNAIIEDDFHAFALYAALNALILLILGALVVRARVRTQVGIGDGGLNEVARPIRAHGNNSEYTPTALILMLAMIPLAAPAWLIHAVGLPLTVGRLLHGIGLSRDHGPTPLRLAGILLTYLAYIVGIVALLWLALVPGIVAS